MNLWFMVKLELERTRKSYNYNTRKLQQRCFLITCSQSLEGLCFTIMFPPASILSAMDFVENYSLQDFNEVQEMHLHSFQITYWFTYVIVGALNSWLIPHP
jgi:hypothetical protein